MIVCPICKAKVTGLRLEHCTACHQTFASTRAGDDHRYGPYDGQRKCRTPEEMVSGGMWSTVNPYGHPIWHGEFRKDGRQKRRQVGGPE